MTNRASIPHGPDSRHALLRRVDAACAELRRGRLVVVTDGATATLCVSAETAKAADLAHLKSRTSGDLGGDPCVALTAKRAAILRIQPTGDDVVTLPLAEHFNTRLIRSLADPTHDLDNPMRGPLVPRSGPVDAGIKAAVRLAKLAQLLPSVIAAPLVSGGPEALTAVSVADIDAYDEVAALSLHPVSSARVPLAGAENTRVIAFRPEDGGVEHLAILVGEPDKTKPVLTRLHSECFTGDLLGSLKCDCGEQLRGAIEEIGREGAGVLLYLAQEGRGIGLINKLRAYRLQDEGYDTIEANERLGFDADERLFLPAAEMLNHLGFTRVRLMTNNPDKVAALSQHGIEVTERVEHAFPSNAHNELYLATKAKRSGHYLSTPSAKAKRQS